MRKKLADYCIVKCSDREFKINEQCIGHWWCNKKNCQINVYEDCKKCKEK